VIQPATKEDDALPPWICKIILDTYLNDSVHLNQDGIKGTNCLM
jgi:hypothetical protein